MRTRSKALKYIEVVWLALLFGLMLATGYSITELVFGGNPAKSKEITIERNSVEFPELALSEKDRAVLTKHATSNSIWKEIFNEPEGRAKRVIMIAATHDESGKPNRIVSAYIAQSSSTYKAKRSAKQGCYDGAEKYGLPVICYVVWVNDQWVGD